jgi:hypothetical protein
VAKNIHIDQLAAEITLSIKEYTDDVSEAIEVELDKTSKDVLSDIRANSPVRTGEYRKGWRRKKEGAGGEVRYIIHNKDRSFLVHLLEFGHAKAGGGRVAGKPHLLPAYDKHVPGMEERIKRIIRNGG